jgi:hypothetical protein
VPVRVLDLRDGAGPAACAEDLVSMEIQQSVHQWVS